MIGALLLSRWRLAKRALLRRPGPGQTWLRHPAVTVAIGLWMGAFVYGGMHSVFTILRTAGASPAELAGALALALSASLVALLVFDVDDAVRTLVQDADLELLRRAPVPPATLLALKSLDAAPRTLTPLLVLAVPALLAYSTDVPVDAWFAPVAVVSMLALWALPLALGATLGLLLLRVVPAARARESLALLSTLTLTTLWIAGAVWLPRGLEAGSGAIGGLREALARGLSSPAPSAAAARALAAAVTGSRADIVRELTGLLALVAVAIGVAILVARANLAPVLERVAAGSVATPRARRSAEAAPAGTRRWRGGGPIAAILRRDGRLLRRNWTLLGDLLVASTLWVLLPLAGMAKWDISWELLARVMLLTVSVGLGYEIAARSIPFERHLGYWSRVSPLPAGRWLAAKVIGAGLLAIPVVVLAGTVLGAVRPLPAGVLWRAACVVTGALTLSISSGVWAGLVFGDPEWINPRAMLRLSGRLATSGLLLLQIALWLGVIAAEQALAPTMSPLFWLGAPVLGALFAALPVMAAVRRLETLGLAH
jgi:ABC-2 type transport system permease protein